MASPMLRDRQRANTAPPLAMTSGTTGTDHHRDDRPLVVGMDPTPGARGARARGLA